MPFAEIQAPNGGSITGTSGSASLPLGTTAGNTVFVAVATAGANAIGLTGFTRDVPSPTSTQRAYLFRKSNVAAGETSWAFTGLTIAQPMYWVAWEEDGPDPVVPVDAAPTTFSSATGTTVGSGAMPQTSAYDAEVWAVAVAYNSAGTTPETLSGHTNGFVEYATGTAATATVSVRLSVSRLPLASIGTPSTTVTAGSSTALGASAVVYASATSKRLANVVQMCGFEPGVSPTATGPLAYPLFDAVAGSPTVTTSSPRSGVYCLELSSTAAAEWVQWSNNSTGSYASSTSPYQVDQMCVYLPASLPSGDVDLFSTGAAAPGEAKFRYRSATQKIGVQIGAGTEQLSTATLAADTWYVVDLRMSMAGTTWTVDWALDGVDQTQAILAGQVASAPIALTLGWTGASTATVRYDDVLMSRVAGQFPFGGVAIQPLKVDPAGTVAVSGSTVNFGVMTANGTIGTWNAANALAAVDDVPPTIGAAADGVVAVTASATDYVEFPMETRDAAANGESIRAVKAYFPLWAAAATAATIRLQANDGTTTYMIYNEADPNADNSTTDPAWVCKMVRTLSNATPPIWTQAKLDALVLRMGSNDATPDIGIHSIMAEVAVRAGETRTLIGSAGDVTTAAAVDPDSGAVVAATLSTPADRGATLRWTDPGGSGSQAVVAAGSYTKTFPAAVDATSVSVLEVESGPEAADRY